MSAALPPGTLLGITISALCCSRHVQTLLAGEGVQQDVPIEIS